MKLPNLKKDYLQTVLETEIDDQSVWEPLERNGFFSVHWISFHTKQRHPDANVESDLKFLGITTKLNHYFLSTKGNYFIIIIIIIKALEKLLMLKI